MTVAITTYRCSVKVNSNNPEKLVISNTGGGHKFWAKKKRLINKPLF
jgi:hypothetical protein